MHLCVCVCFFVCYKKGSITFDPNNATVTQKIDDYMGWVINFIWPKTRWNVLGCRVPHEARAYFSNNNISNNNNSNNNNNDN